MIDQVKDPVTLARKNKGYYGSCRAGRQLIYQLSAHHRNSLLLNFAIQKILRAGHEDEVASVGASLASYFGVFHRLMTNRLKEVPTADAARLRALTAELKVRTPL